MKLKLNLKFPPLFPLAIILMISLFALLMLYSVGSGSFYPWSFKQFCRLIVGIAVLFVTTSVKMEFWKKYSYMLYAICFALLVFVSIIGKVSMGAQRWLNLYFFNFQPSELMRVSLVIVLAKYFSVMTINETQRTYNLLIPTILVLIPVGLVLLQPDLGTAMLLFCIYVSILFACGVQIWKFVVSLVMILVSAPILWGMLHEYQRNRILMFLSPESDPSGAGYHIIQSQIAIGSGGFFGKGFMNGTQSQLNFLPEKQTDFVFATLGEELGFLGCLLLITLYGLLLAYNLGVAFRAKNKFNQIMVFGLSAMLFFYIFINISMVCGLLPVVGIPLPFFSYGGSALLVLMFCQGLIFAADLEQKERSGLIRK